MYNVGNTLSWGTVHVQCREYLIQGEWYMYSVGNTCIDSAYAYHPRICPTLQIVGKCTLKHLIFCRQSQSSGSSGGCTEGGVF